MAKSNSSDIDINGSPNDEVSFLSKKLNKMLKKKDKYKNFSRKKDKYEKDENSEMICL